MRVTGAYTSRLVLVRELTPGSDHDVGSPDVSWPVVGSRDASVELAPVTCAVSASTWRRRADTSAVRARSASSPELAGLAVGSLSVGDCVALLPLSSRKKLASEPASRPSTATPVTMIMTAAQRPVAVLGT